MKIAMEVLQIIIRGYPESDCTVAGDVIIV